MRLPFFYALLLRKEDGKERNEMKKIILVCMLALVAAFSIAGCSTTNAQNECCQSDSTQDSKKSDCCKGTESTEISDVPDCCGGE